jgi:hypothetical protein
VEWSDPDHEVGWCDEACSRHPGIGDKSCGNGPDYCGESWSRRWTVDGALANDHVKAQPDNFPKTIE